MRQAKAIMKFVEVIYFALKTTMASCVCFILYDETEGMQAIDEFLLRVCDTRKFCFSCEEKAFLKDFQIEEECNVLIRQN